MKLGDYVTAKLVGEDACRQGVFTGNNPDGTITVEGIDETYTCEANATVVADRDVFLPETHEHIQKVRQRLGQ